MSDSLISLKDENKFYHRGNEFFNTGFYNNAVEDFSEAIRRNPKFAKAYNNRGNAYCRLKNFSTAIEDYTTAIKLEPNSPRFYNNRGFAYERMYFYKYAIDDYKKSISIISNFAGFYDNIGHSYLRIKDYSNAISNYEKCIELDCKKFSAMLGLAITYNCLGNIENAKKYYSDAMNTEKKLSQGMIGIELLEKEGWELSYEDKLEFKKLLELNNQQITPYLSYFGTPDKNGKMTGGTWKPVSNSIVKSPIKSWTLYQPVWAHTIRGAIIGAILGMIYWFANGVYFYLFKEINVFIGSFFAFLLCCLLVLCIPSQNIKNILLGLLLFSFAGLIFGAIPFGFEKVFGGFTSFLWELGTILGAIIVGVLSGGLPGMIIGTIIGLIRKGKIPVSPLVPKEDLLKVVIRGIIIPFVLTAFLVVLFYTYYQPKNIEIYLKSVIKNEIKKQK